MTTQGAFSKKYNPDFEKDIYEWRKKNNYFKPVQSDDAAKEKFVVTLPPPNVTGKLHIGHSCMIAIEDTMARFHRMSGHETVWIPGTDHAGISTQVVVEKQLAKEGIDKHEFGREKFLAKVWDWALQSRSTIIDQTMSMGASLDWSREQFTVSEHLSRSVRAAFKSLYESEKIYKSTYLVNWSPGAQTVLSDLEVEHREVDEKMHYIRYFVQGKGDSITVATIRPETIFADVAIAVHPKDRRYKKWIGKNVLIPIVNRPIPVVADEHVQIEFGTGALKITPAHDEADFEVAVRHELPLDHFAFDKQCIFSELAGEGFAGKNAYEFKENLVYYLNEIGNLEKIEVYKTTVPFCERTGARVEPLLSQQWFMAVAEAAEKVKDAVESESVEVHPPRFKATFTNWLDEIRPWCISRQLWWGHRIPVWYDAQGKKYVFSEENVIAPHTGNHSTLSKMIFNLIADSRLAQTFTLEELIQVLTTQSLTDQNLRVVDQYCALYSYYAASDKTVAKELKELEGIFGAGMNDGASIEKQGGLLVDLLDSAANISGTGDSYTFHYYDGEEKLSLEQEEDVLDTWFSSALWPFSTLGWPEKTEDMDRYYPNTVLETGYDIIFFWVIRMMLMGTELTGQMPFKNVYLHGLVRAEDGQKMSKSKGNGIDPMKMIEEYGADSLRGSLILGNTPGNDQRFSQQKTDYVARFINKLWNASRFVSVRVNPSVDEPGAINFEKLEKEVLSSFDEMNDYDAWIIGKTHETIDAVTRYQKKFMMGDALQDSITLVWHEFCDWFIEIGKLQTSPMTNKVMLYCLGTFYKLLHPTLPFVTEKLWALMGFEGALIVQPWPKVQNNNDKNYRINLLMDMISQWRTLRQEVTKKPHEQVDLFVQSNKDIHHLVQDHIALITDIVRVKEISYIDEHQETGDGFAVSMLMDIKLGVKGLVEIDWREQLKDLEKQIDEEEKFLQRVRASLSSPGFMERAPKEVVDEKKKKMDEVKSKISHLNYEINKIKMNHK